MKSFNFVNIVLILFIVFVIDTKIEAQNVSKRGTTVANILEIGVGAKANGMGGAFVSISSDASSLYWNAAGISKLEQYEAVISHTDWIADTKYDYAGLVIPMGEFGSFGFSFSSLSMDDMIVRTVEKPDGTGEYFSAGDIAFGITYSRMLTDRFSIGMTVKYIEQNIWHMSASAFAVDFGTIFHTDLFGGMTIGAVMSNFGTPMQLEGRDARYYIRVDDTKLGSNERIPVNIELDKWDLPLFFQLGLSTNLVDLDSYKLTVAVDAVVPSNDYQSLNIGAELTLMNYLKLRAGYNSLLLEEAEGGLSFGVGVDSKMLLSVASVNFDYSFRDFGRLNNVHSFSVGIKF